MPVAPQIAGAPRRFIAPSSGWTNAVKGAATARVPTSLRILFLLFVFTIPIESLNVSLQLGSMSLARISGLLLFAGSVLYFKRCYSAVPPPVWWIAVYLTIFMVTGAFVTPTYRSLVVSRLLSLVQVVVFLWMASNLLRDQKFSRKVLLTYALSTVLLVGAVRLGIPGFAPEIATNYEGSRFSTLGANPNYLGLVLAVAAVIWTGFALERRLSGIPFLIPAVIVLSLMIQTGSRAAVVAFIMGIWCYLLPFGASRRKIAAVILVGIAVIIVGYLTLSSPDLLGRWQRTIYEGNSAGRDVILASSLSMISERPFWGWGPVEYQSELMLRFSNLYADLDQDPHNLILSVVLEVGIIGGMPLFIAIALCGGAAWKARAGELGVLPFALLVTLLVGLQFHTWLLNKPLWLILAACLAANGSNTVLLRRQRKANGAPPSGL